MSTGAETTTEGRCAYHVDRVARGICPRCGSYYCASCFKDLGGKELCTGCLAIPGIDYLAEIRAKAWGKRDGWIWYLGGFGSLAWLGVAIGLLGLGSPFQALSAASAAAILVAYFFMQPWARKAIFATVPLGVISVALGAHAQDANGTAYATGAAIGRSLILVLFLIAADRSTRNKLAFKLEVSELELSRYYDTYVSNPQAKRALAYGALSVFIPLLIPVAVLFGVRGLRRANSDAWPPAGHGRTAIIGLACSGLSAVLWLGTLGLTLMR